MTITAALTILLCMSQMQCSGKDDATVQARGRTASTDATVTGTQELTFTKIQ